MTRGGMDMAEEGLERSRKKLEKMGAFFDARLDGYEEHQLTTIESARAFYPFTSLSAGLFGHFDPDGGSALGAVSNTRLPILLIHGEADDFVPCSMSREIAAACAGPVRLETFPGAGHGGSYLSDPERYRAVVLDFLRSCGGA